MEECPDKKDNGTNPPEIPGKEGEPGNLGAALADDKGKKDKEDKKEAAPSYANRPMKAPFKDWSEAQWNEYVKSTGHKVDEPAKKAGFEIRPGHPEGAAEKTGSCLGRDGAFNPQRHDGPFKPQLR